MDLSSSAFNPLELRGSYSATSNNIKLVHWPLMGWLLHLVQPQPRPVPSSLYPFPVPAHQQPVYLQSYWCIALMVRCSAI